MARGRIGGKENHTIIPRWVKKCTNGGYPLECPFLHVIPTWCLSTNQLPGLTLQNALRSHFLAYSALFSPAVQDGEVPASNRALLRAYYSPDGHDIHPVEPSHGKGLLNRPVPSNPERRPHPFGQAVFLGSPDSPNVRSRSLLLGCQAWGPFLPSHPFFSWFVVVFPDLDLRRTVLWPIHLCVCPRRCRLNWAARFWVPKCSWWFFFRFLDHPGGPTRVSYLSMGRPPHLWIRLQSLCAHDGWVDDRRFDFWERDQFINGRGCGNVWSCRRPHESGLGRLAPAHDLSN